MLHHFWVPSSQINLYDKQVEARLEKNYAAYEIKYLQKEKIALPVKKIFWKRSEWKVVQCKVISHQKTDLDFASIEEGRWNILKKLLYFGQDKKSWKTNINTSQSYVSGHLNWLFHLHFLLWAAWFITLRPK